ncbi:MAG: helix-turn-helix transcriptional regulator [Spirochaetes bacterium]|nr:helix-turn-helix transcriptional regulator [Spirochaetota bacterium]
MGFLRFSLETNRRLQVANFSHFKEPFPHPDRVMEVHDLVYLHTGAWDIGEEGEVFRLKPGDVIVLAAGRRHFGPSPCAPGTRTRWIHLHPEPADAYSVSHAPRGGGANAVEIPTLVHCGRDPEIRALFEAAIHHHWSSDPLRRLEARLVVSRLLFALALRARRSSNPSLGAIDTVIALLENRPQKPWRLDELAAQVGLERRTLTSHFRRRTGTSIHRFALEHRLRMAASVLAHTPGTTVRSVAEQFGFWDEFHFSRAFKKFHGRPPSRVLEE